jgi:outer membrane protein OmpA-like peptidoglycan-associated protein
MRRLTLRPFGLEVLLTAAALAAVPEAHGQWSVAMRAMLNPLPVGQCTPIEIVVTDANGAAPLRPNGSQLDWQDFELSFAAASPDAFAWSDEGHRFLCARAPTAGSAIVSARYPGAHLQPHQRVPGVVTQQTVEVVMQAAPSPTPGQPQYPEPAAPASSDPSQPHAPAAHAASAAAPGGSPPPAQEAKPAEKGVGGLFKKIGEHIKRKAGDVTTETAQRLASTATQVVDTTLETGSGLVSSTAAEAGNQARMTIGGVGQSLMPDALQGGDGSDNLATVVSSGHAVLRMMRFTGGTDVLEPSSRELAKRLAEELQRIPGTFVIEAHVDPLLSPAASQQLSENRAAAVKRALIGHGIQAERLIALGYGASEPQPEVPPEGGSPSSARIEILRAQ